MKKILIALLAAVMLFTLAGCSGSNDFEADLSNLPAIEGADFETLIDDFVEDHFNVIALKTGEKEKPFDADYTLNNGGKCYTSDESVATVSDSGTIKAVGRGVCYVVLVGDENVFGRDIGVYKVMVDAPAGMLIGNLFSGMPDGVGELMSIIFTVMGVLFLVGVGVVIFIVVKEAKNNKTTAPGFDVPQQPGFTMPDMGTQQPDFGGAAGKTCPKCGQQAEGAFCPYCGTKL